MAYRLKVTETIPQNVRRIAAEEIKYAVSRLRGKDVEKRMENIHEARKAIKRLRALLRLVRPELGTWFRRENTALRNIGRSLSELRDSSIVLETFDALSDDAAKQQNLQAIRAGLQERKTATDKTLDPEKTLQDAAESLTEVSGRVAEWPLKSDGFEALAEGLKTEYQGGRKAMPKALKKNDSLLFHEWRKRAKCQLFHMRLLKNVLTDSLRQQEEWLHALESALGDDHNLLILRQQLDDRPQSLGGKKKVQQSLGLVSEREVKLRTEAEALGEKIYVRKASDFVEELRGEWEKAAPAPPTPGESERKTAGESRKAKSAAA